MNYRHDFHAGGFADVIKHIVLVRMLAYLHEKPAAFRVIDTHAGIGLYDLSSEEAQKTGEWQGGIGRVLDAGFAPEAAALLAPYLDAWRRKVERLGTLNFPQIARDGAGNPILEVSIRRDEVVMPPMRGT